ncbi:hypothetical protein [uncultured Psychrobacter sp.]|uniref:hypothetical protein n=1 Tax=uncultured Psychrobacter sp. TaxID=259303 RepID=UPI0030DB7CC7
MKQNKLTKEQIAANIERTGLPNPDFKLPLSTWLLAFLIGLGFVTTILYIGLSANAEREEREANSPNVTQAGVWMRGAAGLPKTPESEVFISELGVAMSDGKISDEEYTRLSTDYDVLLENK